MTFVLGDDILILSKVQLTYNNIEKLTDEISTKFNMVTKIEKHEDVATFC